MTKALKQRISWITGLVALIGTLWGGYVALETRYAKADEVREQINETNLLYLYSERNTLRRQKFEIDLAAERRALTPLEETRLQELTDELRDLNEQTPRINGK